ncbi:E3 SUMO-protein ligase ZNF451 isoform X2 [Lacerta agilis]|uniref:E3 SUMO-protein ligase ZNF451 isoform X2 n=1 Tax=Lacerta agilis TaxID=80427 RepID=UPI0014193B1F|nr:E3 SUMO-protein ligase ZNF451 isoform X2 [Lacerta agilis]
MIMECLVSSKRAENASSEQEESEDDIEFVGEAVLKPVLDCIELSSGDEDDSSSSNANAKRKDYVDYQKEKVASTLDRLARHVEVEKQLKEEKNKAFKEKLDLQHAHGLQELEFMQGHSDTEAARQCVNQWLKMPGLKPGTVNSGRRALPQRSDQIQSDSKSILCPIMHCHRKFDNRHLLLGHLQRFDHSPCDPSITLHGCPADAFACIVCNRRFPTSQLYNEHVSSKASEGDGHEKKYPPQRIQCFACPCCFLLFSIRDECLQHMSEKNHFSQAFQLSDKATQPQPLPFPAYAKNLLISLCKEIPFQVKCTSCHQVLRSHVELTAHFRIRCRDAGPVTLSKKRICQVAEVFKAKGFCHTCSELFINDTHIRQHISKTQHKVKVFTTMEESILTVCHVNERNKSASHLQKNSSFLKSSPLKRPSDSIESVGDERETVSKRIKDSEGKSQEVGGAPAVKTWVCQCELAFPSEELVENHIFSENRICHKCGVCGKLAENASVIRLHMSRFHGGAHLTNFVFWCQVCSVALQKADDVKAHVTEYHGVHSFYREDVAAAAAENATAEDATASSGALYGSSLEQKDRTPSPMEQSPPSSPMDVSVSMSHQWQCCMCEELFDSEDSVKHHCVSLESHHFHRYSCELCKMTFRKNETFHRHCQDKHNGVVKVKYFCGFCGDLYFDAEEEFLLHFKGFHSTDYICVSEGAGTSIKSTEIVEESNCLRCGCRERYVCKENRKADYERCQKALLEKGNLWFRCTLCSSTTQSFPDMKAHLVTHSEKKPEQELYIVRCGACSKNFSDIGIAQQHFHSKHCSPQKPQLAPTQAGSDVFQISAGGSCADKKPENLMLSEGRTAASPSEKRRPGELPKEQGKKPHSEGLGLDDRDLPDLDYLCTMTHIIMMDLDNWGNLFHQLPATLNQGTFIWGFQGGHNNWKPPVNCKIFNYLNKIGCFFLHPHCGTRREAADFAICVHVGRLDEHLPKHIPFTILSGDKSFLELEDQLKMTQRATRILDPHKIDADMMYALLNSISDTAKENEVVDTQMGMEQVSEETKDQKDSEEDAAFQEAIRRSMEEM